MTYHDDIFVGIDYSYTSPAITILDNGVYYCYALWHQKTLPNQSNKFTVKNFDINLDFYDNEIKYNTDLERYLKLADWAIGKINLHTKTKKNVHIALEGYSMGSRIGFLFNIAENTAILKSNIIDRTYHLKTFIACPPTLIKKFATKKGNAKKPDMANSFFKEHEFYMHEIFLKKNPDTNPASDIVDSYFILSYLLKNVNGFGKISNSIQKLI